MLTRRDWFGSNSVFSEAVASLIVGPFFASDRMPHFHVRFLIG